MKTVIVERDLFEVEIKPHARIAEYRRLVDEDVRERLLGGSSLTPFPCPGCLSYTSQVVFTKSGMAYRECADCKTVYVSPRPSEETLVDFYRNSKSARFWREQILRETKETRRDKVFRPRAQWMLSVIDRYRPEARLGIVVGYHNDLLVEELTRQESHLFHMIVTNAIADIEFRGSERPNVTIRPTPVGVLCSLGPADVLLAFDIVDRCADVEALLSAAHATLAPGGLLLASTISISGFDLQVLWDRSETIYPPERLNLLSTEGLIALFERQGFETLEFSTPGVFDVEAVQRAIQKEPEAPWPRFIRYVLERRDEDAMNGLQEYLQRYRLSSFARMVLRKPR